MTKELIFHLGDHKTGSTSIQAVLRAGTIKADRSIGYPTTGLHHASLAKAILAPKARQGLANRFASLREMIDASDADIEVISAERFEGLGGDQLRPALEEFMPDYLPNTRVIAYVRPHAERVVSSWSEQMKLGNFTGSLDAFFEQALQTKRFEFFDRFKSWRDAFGDAFELRPMVRGLLYNQDVVQDFVQFVLQGTDFTIEGDTAANESLTLQDLAVLRVVSGHLDQVYSDLRLRDHTDKNEKSIARDLETVIPRNNESAIARNLAMNLAAHKRAGGIKPAIHESLVARVQDHYAADAAALDAEFFDGTPMTDALTGIAAKAVAEPQVLDPETLLTPEEMRLAQAMGTFIGRVALIAPKEWVNFFTNERTGTVYDILAASEEFKTRGIKKREKELKSTAKAKVSEKMAGKVDKANLKAQKAQERAEEKTAKAEERAEARVAKKAERAKARAEKKTEKAKERAELMAAKKAERAKERAQGHAEQKTEKVKERIKERAEQMAEKTKERADAKVGKAKEQAEQALKRAGEMKRKAQEARKKMQAQAAKRAARRAERKAAREAAAAQGDGTPQPDKG